MHIYYYIYIYIYINICLEKTQKKLKYISLNYFGRQGKPLNRHYKVSLEVHILLLFRIREHTVIILLAYGSDKSILQTSCQCVREALHKDKLVYIISVIFFFIIKPFLSKSKMYVSKAYTYSKINKL